MAGAFEHEARNQAWKEKSGVAAGQRADLSRLERIAAEVLVALRLRLETEVEADWQVERRVRARGRIPRRRLSMQQRGTGGESESGEKTRRGAGGSHQTLEVG
jgi:hypothetical protein